MERGSAHHPNNSAEESLLEGGAADDRPHSYERSASGLTLGKLARTTRVSYQTLYESVSRRREAANYRTFFVRKRSGGKRLIHSVSNELAQVQRFLNDDVLQSKSIRPHENSFAFHRTGGTRLCAERHCGARWLFRYDLEDFFFGIDEIAAFEVFRELGFRRLMAFELARLCTTTMLPEPIRSRYCKDANANHARRSRRFYNDTDRRLGVLAQGAATSPMLANLACRSLDESLAFLAHELGMVYTRYADDIVFSSTRNLDRRSEVPRVHRAVRKSISSEGFSLNERKTQISGPGARKVVLGLLVDGEKPQLTRQMRKRVDRLLHACETYGLAETARHEGFHSMAGFRNHLGGLGAYAADVDPNRGAAFLHRFRALDLDEGDPSIRSVSIPQNTS